jgi:hypothetical protein
MGKLHLGKLHRERAVSGRIFQALPTQTNRQTYITITLIYMITSLVRGHFGTITLNTSEHYINSIFLKQLYFITIN